MAHRIFVQWEYRGQPARLTLIGQYALWQHLFSAPAPRNNLRLVTNGKKKGTCCSTATRRFGSELAPFLPTTSLNSLTNKKTNSDLKTSHFKLRENIMSRCALILKVSAASGSGDLNNNQKNKKKMAPSKSYIWLEEVRNSNSPFEPTILLDEL